MLTFLFECVRVRVETTRVKSAYVYIRARMHNLATLSSSALSLIPFSLPQSPQSPSAACHFMLNSVHRLYKCYSLSPITHPYTLFMLSGRVEKLSNVIGENIKKLSLGVLNFGSLKLMWRLLASI